MLTYGEIIRDPALLPAITIERMLQRTFAHMLGNEVSSAIVSMIRTEDRAGKDASTEAVTAWREANAAQVSIWVKEKQAEILGKMDDGTLGVSGSRGPRVDPLAKIVWQLGIESVASSLRSLNLHSDKAAPKASKVFTLGKDQFTFADLVTRRIARDGEKLTVEATRVLAAREREAKRRAERIAAIAAEVPTGAGNDAEALGL